MIPEEWLLDAEKRLSGWVIDTPVTYDPELNVYLKWENQQRTGSFKIRGAVNKVLSLQDWERAKGLVAASAGNHGQGVALAARELNLSATIFASEHASEMKLAAMRAMGASIRLVPGGYAEAEKAGLQYALETGAVWVSPYNDGQVIAGQGTIGLEIMRQIETMSEIASCVVPVSGGGLISGIGMAFRSVGFSTKLIGVQTEAAPYFYALKTTGTQAGVLETDSIADGLSGEVEANSITIPMVLNLVDEVVLVSEHSIERAISYAWFRHKQVIEGSAAVSLAAVLEGKIQAYPALLVISGGNINPDLHRSIVTRNSQDWKSV
ncbi:MAG: threonine/serine dehydratase [Anaerolineaceae bacterium]|nr:threonine/serine dehydratase [Anaerolineaceae bacterium]